MRTGNKLIYLVKILLKKNTSYNLLCLSISQLDQHGFKNMKILIKTGKNISYDKKK